MSRLLSALKRLDDGGAKTPPDARRAARDEQPPSDDAKSSSPSQQPLSSATTPTTPTPPTTEYPTPPWPGGDASTSTPAAREPNAAPTVEATAEPGVAPQAPTQPTPNQAEPQPHSPGVQPTAATDRRSRAASPGRRVSDHYRVTPEYAALCQTILDRVPRTRPTAILLVAATEDIDAGTVAAELALSLAQGVELPVVAVDADFAAETAESEPISAAGLADVLLDRVDWRGVLAPARDGRVQLLSAGRPLSAAECRGNDSLASAATRLGPLAAEIKSRYRYLIVHGGATSNPLCGALVQAADLIYLVVRLGQTTRRQARAARRALQRGGAILHGSILIAN